MAKMITEQRAKIMAAVLALGFLLIHITLFLIFRYYGVTPMARFNIFSIIFYVLMLGAINAGRFKLFALATYLEVVLHMTLATCYTGRINDFHITLIGIIILLFYSEYVGRTLKLNRIHSVPLSLVSMLCYLTCCVIDRMRPAPYHLPESLSFVFQIAWALTVFIIAIIFLYIFVEITTGSEQMLVDEVTHDQLTGLPNRYFIADYISELVDGEGLDGHWVAMLDIDDFKMFNDTYGHNCGDYILTELADVLQSECGRTSTETKVCRWGGEEFLLLGKFEADDASAERRNNMIEGVRKTVENHRFVYENMSLHLTITIGVADYSSGIGTHEWIGLADQKLYYGKSHGKNQVVA